MTLLTGPRLALAASLMLAAGCVAGDPGARSRPVPEPAKPVSLERYMGRWHELARYDNSFQTGCDGVTADYALRPDGRVSVVNACRTGGPQGPRRVATATARLVPGAPGNRLKVSFFPPFEGDYWVLDRADDYSWAIVGEPSGRYLWILSRRADVPERVYRQLVGRAAGLGYDVSRLRRTQP
ncbi:lipocalin family protein [Camelimonas abortus]|uniref:Outer membrane lipoprotein Blc n=1 Tax=Camelimonas abortus TaxID=1017184 RepID=A0ABV7LAS6_9HYPH